MTVPVVLPELGGLPATLSLWLASPGDPVIEGDRLVEVLVGPTATFDVSAPATGRLIEQLAGPRDRLTAGQVLGTVEEEAL